MAITIQNSTSLSLHPPTLTLCASDMQILYRAACFALLAHVSVAAPSPRAVSDVSADLATALQQTIQIARDQLSSSPPSVQDAIADIKALTSTFDKALQDGKGTTFKKADRAAAALQVEDLSNAMGAACEGFTANVQAYSASKDDVNAAYQDLYDSFQSLNDVINPPNKKKDSAVKNAFLDWYQGFSRCQLAFDPPPCYGDLQPDGSCGGYGTYSEDGSAETQDAEAVPAPVPAPAPVSSSSPEAIVTSASGTPVPSSSSSTTSSTRATQSPQSTPSSSDVDSDGYGVYVDPSAVSANTTVPETEQESSPADTGYGLYSSERSSDALEERIALADFAEGGISRRAEARATDDGYAAAQSAVQQAKAAFDAIAQVAKGTNDTSLIIPKINATTSAFKSASQSFSTSFTPYTSAQSTSLAQSVSTDLAASITATCDALIGIKPSIPVDAPYLGDMYDALYFLTLSMLPYSYLDLSKSFAQDVDPSALINGWSKVDQAYHACRDAYPQVVYCYTCYSS